MGLWLVLVFAFASPLISIDKERLITTYWKYWEKDYFTLSEKNKIIQRSGINNQKIKVLYQFSKTPNLIRHYRMEGGDLFATITGKTLELFAFDHRAKLIYQNQKKFEYPLREIDVRIEPESGEPVVLLHVFHRQNNMLKIWYQDEIYDVYASEKKFTAIFLQWSTQTVHVMHRTEKTTTWVTIKNPISKKGIYRVFKIGEYLRIPRFFVSENTMYLLGIDTRYSLVKFELNISRIRRSVLIQDRRLAFSQSLVMFTRQGQFQVLLVDKNQLRLMSFASLNSGSLIATTVRPYLIGKIIHPLFLKNEMKLTMGIGKTHYLEKWKINSGYIKNFRWQLQGSSLLVKWSGVSSVQYRYLLDKRPYSKPLPENKFIPSGVIKFGTVSEGDHYLHIQWKSGRAWSELYHIPIFWRYQPETPKIITLREIAPQIIQGEKLQFFITNFSNNDYFGKINSIPRYTPRERLQNDSGRIILKNTFKPGRYYLHIRSRDPQTNLFSITENFLFFIGPFNPAKDRNLNESSQNIGKLRILLDQLDKAKTQTEMDKIRFKLEKLEEKIED